METTKESAAAEARRVIKRYSNRKLYDTRDSRYVTLQQIGDMVRAGEEVQIIDNKTKEDKTEVTLALILSEGLKNEPRSVPLGALRDLIQERGERLWSQLREGPIGRLIPAGDEEDGETRGAAGEPTAPVRVSVEAPKPERPEEKDKRAEEKKGRLSELMGGLSSLDERIRTIVPSAKSFSELREEVARLSARVSELEATIRGDTSPDTDQKPSKK